MTLEVIEDAIDTLFGHEDGRAVFPRVPRGDGAAELGVQQLHAIADTEHGNAHVDEVIEVDIGSILLERGSRSPGKNHGRRLPGVTKLARLVEARKVAQLPDSTDDELSVLRAEIDD